MDGLQNNSPNPNPEEEPAEVHLAKRFKPYKDNSILAVLRLESCQIEAGAKLLRLPNELLVMIVKKLPFKDIIMLKRVCRCFHRMFPRFCTDPVVRYDIPLNESNTIEEQGYRKMARLRQIISSVTFSTTRALTIFQPGDCNFTIDSAIVKDLKKWCPSLKRLVLKSPHEEFSSNVSTRVMRMFPTSWKVEWHHGHLIDCENAMIEQVHGVFCGPFRDWSVQYVRSRLEEPGFRQCVP